MPTTFEIDGDHFRGPPSRGMRELPHAFLHIPVLPLDRTQAEEKHQAHRRLQELQDAVHEDPVAQRPVAEATPCPVDRQEDPTWDRDQYAGDTAKKHDDLDEPNRLLRVLLHLGTKSFLFCNFERGVVKVM